MRTAAARARQTQRAVTTYPGLQPVEASRRLGATNDAMDLLERYGDRYDLAVRGLHDALVVRARMEEEHDPRARTEDRIRNAVARRRFLAHELTKAFVALELFDRRYPR